MQMNYSLSTKKIGFLSLTILAMCLFAQMGFAKQKTVWLDHKQIQDACMHGVPLANNTYRVWVWGREAAALTVEINGREHRLKSNPKAGKQAYAWKQVGNYTHQGGETAPLRIHVDGRPFYHDPAGIGWLAFSPNGDWDPQALFNQAKVFPHSPRHVEDKRTGILREIRTLYTFPFYKSKKAWLQRKSELRDHLLVTMGCYPEPPKPPLKPHVFDKIQYEDYSIEKVYFESLPGFYVTGNLYRPVGKRGPFPGMLCPHGHWGEGRLTHTDNNSIPTRCINFAKQGYVVFAIDMIGYNDSLQLTHKFGGKPEWLWGLSLHGLQYWNSVRAIDFLLTLEKVNQNRIAVTGASGGGTQTYTLMAVDERVQYAAPVNMLSAHFQGGCLCENAPNLRIDAFNLEFGAMMAPRHLMMIAATGDWTAETPRVEYPAIRSIYKLFNKEERVRMQQFEAPHNYNQA
ncbi:hypothetical protein GF373_07095, partial [bacterium]|nr:hypothetical protein [bacterium]